MTALITAQTVIIFTDMYLDLVRDLSANGTHHDDPQINAIVEAETIRRVRVLLAEEVEIAHPLPISPAQPVGATHESPTKPAAKKKQTRQGAETPSRASAPTADREAKK